MKKTKCSKSDLVRIKQLLRELSGKTVELDKEYFSEVLAQDHFYLLTARQTGNIVGMASIYFVRTLKGLKGYIDNVVVDNRHRGKGLGQDLIKRLIILAKRKGAKYIDLTSKPSRIEANLLYQKLGFKNRKTNVYRLDLK